MKKTTILGRLTFILFAALLVIILSNGRIASASNNGLAQKPYMGWSTYSMQVYTNGGTTWITEAQIKAQSDAMHTKLQSHGYDRINIDASWNSGIDGYGRPVPSAALYPSGFTNLVNYVHANGQKIGIYWIPGMSKEAYNANSPIYGTACHTQDIVVMPLTTADYWNSNYKINFTNPCAQSYVTSIADLMASWGVDFLKFDSVTPGSGHNDTSIDSRGDVAAWASALAPHNIWFELSWALDHNYIDTWKKYANGWRVQWDVECYCAGVSLTNWNSIIQRYPDATVWWRDAAPGGWNDFDSLDIGNGTMDGLTPDERQSAMTLWAMSSAQFYLGSDLTNLDSFDLGLLTNDEVIAVDQAGHPAHPVGTVTTTNQQVWYANNGDGSYTVGLVNLGSSAATVTVNWSDIGLNGSATVRDLWTHTDLGTFNSSFSSTSLPSHASRLLRVVTNGGSVTANDDEAKFTGAWQRSYNRGLGDYKDDVQFTTTNNDYFEYTFKGTGVDVITEKDSSQGNVDIYLDGVFKQTVNTYNATRLAQQTVYSITGLSNASHIIKGVKKTGTYMLLDKLSFSVAAPIHLNDTDAGITYSGAWSLSSNRGFGDYQDDVHWTQTNNDYFQYTFTGTGIDFITEKDSSGGNIDIYVDNVFKQTVSAYNATRLAQQMVYSISGLSSGSHTIKGVKKSGTYMLLDRLSFTGGAKIQYNDTDPGMTYTGAWSLNSNRGFGDYNDDVHFTMTNNDYFQFTFTGTGIEWITEKDPALGNVDIYVDNVFKQTVSTYNATRLTQQSLYSITGLTNASHTFKAVKKTGTYMINDTLRVTP